MSCPANEPNGTPATVAMPTPLIKTPSARELRAGPAAVVATTEATDQNAPVARAVTTRATNTAVNESLSAAAMWPMAKTSKASTSVERRGSRRVASAMAGAPTIIPIANAVISSPICGSVTFRSVAISCRRPATMYSLVHMRKVPSASSGTTSGRRPRASAGVAGGVVVTG
jgi:hypothetical protein